MLGGKYNLATRNIPADYVTNVVIVRRSNLFAWPIHLSGLAIAAIVGIFLNAILPDKLGMKVKSFKGKEKS